MAEPKKAENLANLTSVANGAKPHYVSDSEPSNPFLGKIQPTKEDSPPHNQAILQELQLQLTRMSGNLQDADRKNRVLQDELFSAKRELSEGNTETLLDHKEEIRSLEKEYEAKIKELDKEITDLKQDIRFNKLEYKNTNRDGMTRFLDMVEENGADFFGAIINQLQSAGQNPAQATPQQLQAAIQQQAKAQKSEKQPDPEPDEPEQTEKSENNPQITHEEQVMQAKEQIKSNLLQNALKTLSNSEINIQEYAQFAQAQIAVMQQNNLRLDAQAWVEMARVLAQKAVEENISVERVAEVIKPLLDGVKGYAFMLKALDPEKATDTLFKQFNVEASDEIKNLVSKVLQIIKKTL